MTNSAFSKNIRKTVRVLLCAVLVLFVSTVIIWAQRASADTTQIRLTASDAATDDEFGHSLAISGDTIVVGSRKNDDDGDRSGSAYVFVRSGSTWSQQTKLTANDAEAEDRFGSSVAISGDTIVVGSPYDDDGGTNTGSVYVFVRSGSTWSQQARLTTSDAEESDHFGRSTAISGDMVVAGASSDDHDGISSAGSAYVFVRSGSTWSQQTKLTAFDAEAGDGFGYSVSTDGDTTLVGAIGNGTNGSVYIFIQSGTDWVIQEKLIGSDADIMGEFGTSVAIYGDTAAVGTKGYGLIDTETPVTYVFVRSGNMWTEQAKVTGSDAEGKSEFGTAIALGEDILLVGARRHNTELVNAGAVYVLVREGTVWTEQSKLTSDDEVTNMFFGNSVAISGNTYVVGSYMDSAPVPDSGAIYVIHNPPTIDSVNPEQASQGDTLDVAIAGAKLAGASEVDFGLSITVNSYTVESNIEITANITVAADATLGLRDISVTTPRGTDTLSEGFTISEGLPEEEVAPIITLISPSNGQGGHVLEEIIAVGNFTGASGIDFGIGITVNSYTVVSDIKITAIITIADSATLGARSVSVTTPLGTGTIVEGFIVGETPDDNTSDGGSSGTGCGSSSSPASLETIVSGWGLLGLLGTTGIYVHARQKKRKKR